MKHNYTSRHQHSRPRELARMQAWEISETSVDVQFVTTPDGWQIAISHYRDSRKNPPTRRHPVLLCHGLGANRLIYDIDAQHSLPAWLVAQGYDVYAVDLRGHGLSEKPGKKSGKRWGWGFNEYCDLDIPTAIDAVLAATGKEALHFIGHSMGGILLYCHSAKADTRIVSGITIASTLDFSGHPSMFHFLAPLAGLTHLMPSVPMHWPALLFSKLAALGRMLIDTAFVNPDNVDLHVYRKMTANILHPISSKVLRDMKGFTNGKGCMTSDDRNYEILLREKGYTFPILSISGEADAQCPPASAARFGTHHKPFGKSQGHRESYGHHDLLMGRHAHEEVWPVIETWLTQHD